MQLCELKKKMKFARETMRCPLCRSPRTATIAASAHSPADCAAPTLHPQPPAPMRSPAPTRVGAIHHIRAPHRTAAVSRWRRGGTPRHASRVAIRLWLVVYSILAMCVLLCTAMAAAMSARSLAFLDFAQGLNRASGNVLSAANATGRGYVDCAAYPAACDASAAYAVYFRVWHVPPLAATNAWTAVGMLNPVVDVAEAMYLLAELPSWNATAAATAATLPSVSDDLRQVPALATILLVRAACCACLFVASACIRNAQSASSPWLVQLVDALLRLTTVVGGLVWLGVAASVQSEFLASFCRRMPHVEYALGIVFSFVPGVVAVPIALQHGTGAKTCSLAGAANASVFLALPLAAAWACTFVGGLLLCTCGPRVYVACRSSTTLAAAVPSSSRAHRRSVQ